MSRLCCNGLQQEVWAAHEANPLSQRTEIASQCGVSVSYVDQIYRAFRNWGHSVPKPPTKFDKIRALHKAKPSLSFGEIARRIGCHKTLPGKVLRGQH